MTKFKHVEIDTNNGDGDEFAKLLELLEKSYTIKSAVAVGQKIHYVLEGTAKG